MCLKKIISSLVFIFVSAFVRTCRRKQLKIISLTVRFFFPCVDRRFAVRGPASGPAGRRSEKVSSTMGLRVGQSAAGAVGRGRERRRGRRDRGQLVVARNDDHQTSGHMRPVAHG